MRGKGDQRAAPKIIAKLKCALYIYSWPCSSFRPFTAYKMGLNYVGVWRAVPLHFEATTVSLTWAMAETMIKSIFLKETTLIIESFTIICCDHIDALGEQNITCLAIHLSHSYMKQGCLFFGAY